MRRTAATTTLVALFLFIPLQPTQAAPGTLAQSPLFLGTSVPPNILFLMDDSGSMDWEHMATDRARELFDDAPADWTYIDPTPSGTAEWRELCTAYNAMAYDPDVAYLPWSGTDEDGDTYADAPVNAAPFNPYDTDSDTVDLETQACEEGDIEDQDSADCWSNDVGFFYVAWVDADDDGTYDPLECVPPRDSIPTEGDNYFPDDVDAGGEAEIVYVKDMTAAQRQNYANWFSYHRKREYVMKQALSGIVADATSRMGLRTLHDNNSVNTPIRTLGDTGQPATDRDTLLDNTFRINSSGGTPLRDCLKDVGRYYADDLTGDWTSPILPSDEGGACQQNFTVLLSDGAWNGSDPSGIGDEDSNDDSSYDGGSYADSAGDDTYSDTLADVAMAYYEVDLDAGLDDLVPTSLSRDDTNPAQHMVTYTVGFGVNGTLDANPTERAGSFTWPEPVSGTATTIDDMRHAAWNGRGNFLSAADPRDLIDTLSAAVADIAARSASAAPISFNSGRVSSETVVYLSSFDSTRWSGTLRAYDLYPEPDQDPLLWNAAEVLDDRDLTSSGRDLVTYDDTADSPDGIALHWANLTDAQKTDLNTAPDGTTDDLGSDRLAYLRGDRSDEGEDLRRRDSRLGDIVHSQPVYVGRPRLIWPDSFGEDAPESSYADFVRTHADRSGVIYAGANDGMLHAFAADHGSELFAYIPASLFSSGSGTGLHALTDPAYSHRYYVDLPPTVSDAFVAASSGGTAAWRTVLVGGLRGGGRGLFALDITNPGSLTAANAANMVLWEFDSDDDADLGHTYSRPSIARLANGEWAVIFGNGYNDSGAGTAQVFVLLLEGGLDGEWTLGSDYWKLDTKAGSGDNRNGLATPTVVDRDRDGIAERVYAGDLQGNIWVFDLSSSNTNQWGTAYGNDNSPVPLFAATDGGGNAQPITSAPAVALNGAVPDIKTGNDANQPNLLVLFGTGQYLTTNDPGTTAGQTFYGVWDNGGDSDLSRDDLQVQETVDDAPAGSRVLTRNPVDYQDEDAPEYGWYFDLPAAGERVVSAPLLRGDVALFSTLIPSSETCAYGGSGWNMFLDVQSGGRPLQTVIDFNVDGAVDDDDRAEFDGTYRTIAGVRTDGSLPLGITYASDLLFSVDAIDDDDDDGDDDGPDEVGECPSWLGADQCSKLRNLTDRLTGRISWEELAR